MQAKLFKEMKNSSNDKIKKKVLKKNLKIFAKIFLKLKKNIQGH